MPRTELTSFIGVSSSSSNAVFDPSNAINLYFEKGGAGSRSSGVLLGSPGKLRICNLSGDANRRLYVTAQGRVFCICGNVLYEISSNGTFLQRGTLGSYSGVVSIADSQIELCIVDGFKGYIYNLANNALTVIANNDFPNGAPQVTFLNQRFLCIVPGTGFFRWSNVLDGNTWNLFDEASAEGVADNLVAIIACQGQAWALGTKSKEVFYDTGELDFTFDRVPGTVSDHGCISAFSAVVIGSSLYWMGAESGGSPGIFQSNGYTVSKISDPAREADMATWTDRSQTTGMTYDQKGHTYYQISSTAAGKTWNWDTSVGAWTQRMSRSPISADEGRDIAEFAIFAFGKNLCGDYRNGRVYELSPTTYTEDGNILIRERVGGITSFNGKRVFVKKIGVVFQSGVGAADNCSPDHDPQAMLQVSYNSGVTYGPEYWRSLGKVGQYDKKQEWARLGCGYDIVVKLRISAGVPVAIMSAWADLKVQG